MTMTMNKSHCDTKLAAKVVGRNTWRGKHWASENRHIIIIVVII